MGFNTVAVLLNDHAEDIRKSGRLGERIHDAICAYSHKPRNRIDRYFGAGSIVSMAHADFPQVVVVYQNTGWSAWDENIPPEALEAIARALRDNGYRVTKPKAAPPSREEAP